MKDSSKTKEELFEELGELQKKLSGFESIEAEGKQAEEALRESEEKYRSLFKNMLNGFAYHKIVVDKDNRPVDYIFLEVNDCFEIFTGLKREDIIGKRVSEVIPGIKDSDFDWIGEYGKIALEGGELRFEQFFEPLDRWYSILGFSNKRGYFATVFEDITKRKRAEEALRGERDRASQYLDIAGVMFVAMDTAGDVKLINKKGCEVLGYVEEEIIGKNWFENFIPEHTREVLTPVAKKLLNGEVEPAEYFENPILTRSGEERIIAWHNTIIKDKDGNITGHLSSGEDITERKRAEEQIRASLKEKEVLLKEIHHRVKNNLQVISSILNIQSGYIDDEGLKEIFKESQNRIRSMALVHEKLYESKDLSGISSFGYLNALVANIVRSYDYSSAAIKLNMDVEDIKLDVDTAMHLGLILNELCSNTFKYAFPEDKRGELRIGFNYADDNYRLCVSDDGVGLPEDFDIDEAKSMGFLLVRSMVSQLDGTLEIDHSDGTSFEISFPMP